MEDPWLNDVDNFWVESRMLPGCENIKVIDLLDESGHAWNLDLVVGIFLAA